MSQSSFAGALARVLAHEGGYSNHPADPGGPTNFGITIADYRKYVKSDATAADVKSMRVEDARTIYRARYWDALSCDALPAGVDESVFDYGVNSGVSRAGKVLRRVLGLADASSTVTQAVLAAAAKADAATLIGAINDERMQFLRSLKTWPVFGAGWSRRIAEVRASSLALAAGERDAPASKGAIVPPPAAKQIVLGAGVASSVGAAAWTFAGAHPVPAAGVAAFAAAIAVAIVLALRWRRRVRQNAAAPHDEVQS